MRLESAWEHLEHDEEAAADERRVATEFFADATRSLITSNDSPDIPFRYSINPYRGCEHGCAYCYARPGHENLGMNAGIDFETKVLYKADAAKLLRAELCKPSWQGEFIAMSGVTDCYQPANAAANHARLHRSDGGSPAGVWHDHEELAGAARSRFACAACRQRMCALNITVTTLDADLARDAGAAHQYRRRTDCGRFANYRRPACRYA